MREIKPYWVSSKAASADYIDLMVKAENKKAGLEEEAYLVDRIKNGCQKSLDRLTLGWEYMILILARSFENGHTSIGYLLEMGHKKLMAFIAENINLYSVDKLFGLATFFLRKTFLMHKERRVEFT